MTTNKSLALPVEPDEDENVRLHVGALRVLILVAKLTLQRHRAPQVR